MRGAGSVSIPLGKTFGLQLDGQGLLNGNGLTYGGAVHAFTRNPSSYLAGITAGFVRAPGATLGAVGFEGELYLNEFSIEGWAGVAGLDYVNPAMLDKTGAFAIGDIAYYATPNWRLSLGGSYVLGDTALHLGTEYQFQGFAVPLSVTGDARLHANGSYTLTVGLKGYLGGDDPQKTLVNRHRQDDPPNRGIDLFTAAGDQLYATPPAATPTPPPPDPEALCLAQTPPDNEHYVWGGDNECHLVPDAD